MNNLKDIVVLALNLYKEGLDNREEAATKIVEYVENNYIAKKDLDEALEKLKGDHNERT